MDEFPENFSKSRPLLCLRVYLSILSLLWATRNFDARGSYLQGIESGRKYLGQTSLN